MAKKITQLIGDTDPALTSVIESVKDPSGSPLSRKVELTYIKDLFKTSYDALYSPLDGWISTSLTWTYATANTFTISGDYTSVFTRAVKIKLTQTTVKYFSVVKSTYSAPNTTVTITGGSDYSLANASITSPYYSIVENPSGFPNTFSWNPTFGGFSADPTGTHIFRIFPQGMYVDVQHSVNGTSNATGFSISSPPGVTFPASARLGLISTALDNGVVVTTTPGYVQSNAGGTQYDVVKEFSSSITGWTNTNGKRARFTIIHDIG